MINLSDLPNLVTAKQATKIFFGRDTPSDRNRIYDWIAAGDLKATKRSSKYWISKKEILRVLN